tara:strand:+ start:756 stop:2936 length:2181 start_codon:yes stop_codon:yes gene_type:complete
MAMLPLIGGNASAQTTVDIDSGQTLRGIDILIGFFAADGQSFTLGANTTFEVNSGGTIGNFEDVFSSPIDFHGSTINVHSGGSFAGNTKNYTFGFATPSNANINIFPGGSAGPNFFASNDTIVDVTGGTVGPTVILDHSLFIPGSGAVMNVSGGQLLGPISALSGTTLNLSVVEANIDGAPIALTSAPMEITQRSGTLHVVFLDGNTLSLPLENDSSLLNGEIHPSATLTVARAEVSGAVVIVGDGETLTEADILAGSFNGQSFGLGPETVFQIESGGKIGPIGNPYKDLLVNMSGSRIILLDGSIFTTSTVGSYLGNVVIDAEHGSLLQDSIRVANSSVVNFNGGAFRTHFYAASGSTINYHDGRFPERLFLSNSTLHISGGDFELNGLPTTDPLTNLIDGESLTGISASGEAFYLSGYLSSFGISSIELDVVSVPPAGPAKILIDGDSDLTSIRSGQSVTIVPGGTIPSGATAISAFIQLDGGVINRSFAAVQSDITMSDGLIKSGMNLLAGTSFQLSGGLVESGSKLADGAEIVIDGGAVEGSVSIYPLSTVHLVSGTIGSADSAFDTLHVSPNSLLLIEGGDVYAALDLSRDATVELVVQSAKLNGIEISLEPEVPVIIPDREGALLEVVLADGSDYELVLEDSAPFGVDEIDDDAIVRLRLAKVPPCPADLDPDGILDFFDVSAFLDAFAAQDPIADFTEDGIYDFFDVSDFLDAFGAGCP